MSSPLQRALSTEGLALFRSASQGNDEREEEMDVVEEPEENVKLTIRGAGLRLTKMWPFSTQLASLKHQLSELSGIQLARVQLVHKGRTVNDRGTECIGNVFPSRAKLLLKRGPPVKGAAAATARKTPPRQARAFRPRTG